MHNHITLEYLDVIFGLLLFTLYPDGEFLSTYKQWTKFQILPDANPLTLKIPPVLLPYRFSSTNLYLAENLSTERIPPVFDICIFPLSDLILLHQSFKPVPYNMAFATYSSL